MSEDITTRLRLEHHGKDEALTVTLGGKAKYSGLTSLLETDFYDFLADITGNLQQAYSTLHIIAFSVV